MLNRGAERISNGQPYERAPEAVAQRARGCQLIVCDRTRRCGGAPVAHEVLLLIGLGRRRPVLRTLVRTPQLVEMLERRVGCHAAMDEVAAEHRAGAPDTGTTV